MFGKVTVQIKLVEGDSAGTVTAFYVSIFNSIEAKKIKFLPFISAPWIIPRSRPLFVPIQEKCTELQTIFNLGFICFDE